MLPYHKFNAVYPVLCLINPTNPLFIMRIQTINIFTQHNTLNTNMRKAGVADSVIMEITGHSTREMFDRYNTIDKDDMLYGIKRMEVFLTKQEKRVNKKVDPQK